FSRPFAISHLTSYFFSFFFSCYLALLDLHSFPTRRSSDSYTLTATGPGGSAHASAQVTITPAPPQAAVQKPSEKDISSDQEQMRGLEDRKSTRLNSSHVAISYAVFCLKKKTLVVGTDGEAGHDECSRRANDRREGQQKPGVNSREYGIAIDGRHPPHYRIELNRLHDTE